MLQHLPDDLLVHLLGFLHCSNCPRLNLGEQRANYEIAFRVAKRMSEYPCASHVFFHTAREVIRMRRLCKYWKGGLERRICEIKHYLVVIHESFIEGCKALVTDGYADEFVRREDLTDETSIEDCKHAVRNCGEHAFERCESAFQALRDRSNRRILSLYQERLFFVAFANDDEAQDKSRFQHVLESTSLELEGRVIDV
eukprot:s8322_g5.t1